MYEQLQKLPAILRLTGAAVDAVSAGGACAQICNWVNLPVEFLTSL